MTDEDQARKYTKEEEAEIRQQAIRLIETRKITKTKAASEAGVPFGTFTPWLGGTYGANDASNITRKVANWLEAESAREHFKAIRPSTHFVLTPTAEEIHRRLFLAQHLPDIVPIIGEPGLGKTEAVLDYAERNANVYVVTAEPIGNTVQTMLADIAFKMGIYQNGRGHLTSRGIKEKLRKADLVGTRSLIIIDDAQHYSSEMLDQLRVYYDQPHRCGIALVGNRGILKNLEGGARNDKYAHLFRRAGLRLHRTKAEAEDVTMLLDAWSVRDTKIRSALRSIAQKPGALGVMHKVWSLGEMMARGEDRALELTDINDAYRQMTDGTAPGVAA